MSHFYKRNTVFLGLIFIFLLFFSCQNPKKSATPKKADTPPPHDYYLLIGTYSPQDSTGIYVYTFDSDTGEATFKSGTSGIKNPSFLTLSPNHKNVYAVSETHNDYDGKVFAYSFDRNTGKLTFQNHVEVEGEDPCYISVDPDNQSLFVSNYSSGNLSIIPIKEDGTVDTIAQNIKHKGHGVRQPFQDQAHVHSAILGPDHKNLFVTDLGLDKIFKYPYDSDSGRISEKADTLRAPAGSGPRHMAFSNNGKYLYVIHELGGQIITFKHQNGGFVQIDEISNLPEGYQGDAPESSDLHITPDGKFLYATNRDDLNDITAYQINDKTGKLKFIDRYPTDGKTPRTFTISPDGKFILIGHQRGNKITVFKRDLKSGKLHYSKDLSIPVAHAVDLKMFPL